MTNDKQQMSLFLKIFLWFWLAIALIGGVFIFVSWTTQTEPIIRQVRGLFFDTFNVYAKVAGQIYDNEGPAGLENYLQTLKTSERVAAVAFFDDSGQKIAGDEFPPHAMSLHGKALQSDQVEFDRLPDERFAARKIRLKDARNYVVLVQYRRPQINIPPDHSRWLIRLLAVILTGGLVCYGLARYLTSPVVKLRRATRKLAEGALETRVSDQIGRRGDELSQLAKDFDEMAERIESLVKSEKRLTQDISHELRSPLARLNLALELARQKANHESLPLLERIGVESQRLNEMISRLLILSRLESGGEEIEKQRIDLRQLVEDTVADADFEAQAKGKAVKIGEMSDIRVLGNENLLRSAIENVLRNAVRYTRENTAVEVSLKNSGGSAEVLIEDQGGGVAESELENIFRPFYRIGEARERKSGGTGLGLAIARRAVLAHKGTIQARNTGSGLRVEIKIPLSGS